ncbi:hypothetical protein KC460_04790 [Candidatus Dependentiae bacterium]|nr:hypothetical protein [Candidatus Dependentiae bacterium]
MKYFFRKHFLLFFTLVGLGSSGIMNAEVSKECIASWVACLSLKQASTIIYKSVCFSEKMRIPYVPKVLVFDDNYKIGSIILFNREILSAGLFDMIVPVKKEIDCWRYNNGDYTIMQDVSIIAKEGARHFIRGAVAEIIYQNLPFIDKLSEWAKCKLFRNDPSAYYVSSCVAKGIAKGLIQTVLLNMQNYCLRKVDGTSNKFEFEIYKFEFSP